MSQMELRSVPALKKEIIRLALAAAVQLLFALWFYAFCCGLVRFGTEMFARLSVRAVSSSRPESSSSCAVSEDGSICSSASVPEENAS